MILRGDPAGPLAVPAALSGGSMRVWRVWRVWVVPVALLFALWGCTSPIALVGSVEPATVASPLFAGHAGFEKPAVPGGPVPAAPGAPAAPAPTPAPLPVPTPTAVPGPGPGAGRPHWAWDDLPVSPRARRIDCERIKCVALTFDDGPGAYTGPLLDILARHRARATFFVVGRMVSEDGGSTLRRMVAEGHELGNHTWDHPQLPALSQDGIREELGRTQWLVKQVTGITMILMRPPYGLTDSRVAAESRQLGLAQIMWDVDTLDWRDQDPSLVAQRATEAGPGSIVLMHDIHASTVQAVPRMLDDFAAKGYRFVTLSELYGGRPAPGRKHYGSPWRLRR
ncbi:polysaccharide deacetylase family protein [Streptosporangium sp. NBC_01469]|uniref:polysaccharide deacetylase family protein n=1 Tax=Streptosporangium sp. NBC_01469 TaxID=2903898 RepID=UPI002E2D707F|nr:polysaccharide deacetylase family protein [Streptosporangium sp. NBC_01469]